VDRGFSDAIRWHLSPFERAREDPGSILVQVYVREEDEGKAPAPYSYFRGAELAYQHESLATVFKYALWDIQWFASQNVRAFVALHAGAVGTSEGALLLPAPADTGKSTLVAALLQSGFDYLSDEIGVLDPITGRAYPFPKHLHLDQGALIEFPGLEARLEDRNGQSRGRLDRTVRPGDIGARIGEISRPRALIFMSGNREGPPMLAPLSKAETVERLAANSFNLHRYGDRGVLFLSRVAENVPGFRLDGGTARERANLVQERFPPR
jgi:hypothetical protein